MNENRPLETVISTVSEGRFRFFRFLEGKGQGIRKRLVRSPDKVALQVFDVLPPHTRDFSRELGGLYACEIRICMV